MELTLLANGGAQIVKEGEVIELDAAEVRHLGSALGVPQWRIDEIGDLYYGRLYVLEGNPMPYYGYTKSQFDRLAAYYVDSQPDVSDIEINKIVTSPSPAAWNFLYIHLPS